MYAAISMGIIVVILMVAIVTVTVLLVLVMVRAKSRMQRVLAESGSQVYDEIVTFDAIKNVAYMKHHMHNRD